MRTLLAITATSLLMLGAETKAPDTAQSLYDTAKIWNLHLTFTAEQWAAMEPKGGTQDGGFGGFPAGPGGPGGPGRGGGRGGGFGPAGMLAPEFLKGDVNKDGKLSREEFLALGAEWFTAWDKQKEGKLNEQQVRDGVGAIMPAMGGPGGGPGGPGGPGRGFGRGPGGGMQGQNGRNGLSASMGVDFPYVHADLDFNGAISKDVAVRYKGNSTFMQSRASLKRSLKLDLNKYVKGQKLAGLSKLNLHSEVTDPASLNEAVAYGLFRDAGVPAPRTSWARLYVTVPGKYNREYVGLYSIVEEIDNTFAQDHYGMKDGAILKPSTPSLFGYLGDDWSKYNQTYDPKSEPTTAQEKRIIAFSKLVTSGSDADFAAELGSWIDVDEFARYLAVNVWVVNMDSILAMGQNFYLHLNPTTGKFTILPWDLDLAFGGMGGGAEMTIDHPWRGDNKFLERLFKVDAFRQRYLAHMKEFNGSIFRPERIAAQVNANAAVIRQAVADESGDKLARFEKSVAGEASAAAPGPGGPGGGFGGGGFGGGRGGPGGGNMPIKAFITPRAKSVAAQLSGESKGQSAEGGFGGGPGGMNPGMMIGPAFVAALDENKDGVVTREEFTRGFAKWFDAWSEKKGEMTEEQLRAGIGRDLTPARRP